MITRLVSRSVIREYSRSVAYRVGGGNPPPVRDKLLLTLRPSAYGEDVILDDIYGNLGEDVVIEWRERYGEDVPIVAYIIPEAMRATMFAKLGAGLWFDSAGTAKQVNCIELAQSPEINQWAVWYRLDYAAGLGNREVLFYDPDTLLYSEYIKISNYFKNTSGLYDAILYYDAEEDPDTELTGGPSTFNSSILGPQYQRNADGSYSVTDYNLIPNSEAVGGAVGVAPTGWSIHGGTTNGITRSVVGAGNGYVDYRFSGTASAVSDQSVIMALTNDTPAIIGDIFSAFATVDIISGAVGAGGTLTLKLAEFNSSFGYLTATSSTITTGKRELTRTFSNALAAYARLYVALYTPSGVTVDVTIRISKPQLTKSATQLPYKPTYGTSVATPAVDTLEDGFVGLRSCGAVTNLLPGDTSAARSVTLTAQSYTLQVFGAGSASCSYGTATVGSPLTFTASAGTTTFTPSGATLWILTATSYPTPYVPPGVTQSASNATSSGGNWFTNYLNSDLWEALTGAPLTLATRIKMGVGSGDLLNNTNPSILSALLSVDNVLSMQVDNTGSIRVVRANDGTTKPICIDSWSRNAIIQRFTQVNTTGTQFRVGYMIEGTHTAIQWSSWVNYDGSFNPSTLYRLMIGYNNPYPMWTNKLAVWKRQVSDTELLEVFS